jgi:arylsulfatase A-like enzyme
MARHFDFGTDPETPYAEGAYLADFITDKAVDFIDRHRDQPFFLYLPHFAVHVPYQATKELISKFRGKPPAGGHGDPTYAAMIASIDESVGRILDKLDELKLGDNTVVIFSSDNGGVGGYQEIGGKGITSNAPLRGGKGMLYEGGVRVPFIVRWPGVIDAGGVCNEPTIHVDVYATFLELGGAPKPEQTIDGESLVPLMKDPSAMLKREALYVHFPGYLEGGKNWRTTPVGTIQSGEWKLLEFFETGTLELYNLGEDLGEKNNLAERMPEKTKELHDKLVTWRKRTNAAMPQMK